MVSVAEAVGEEGPMTHMPGIVVQAGRGPDDKWTVTLQVDSAYFSIWAGRLLLEEVRLLDAESWESLNRSRDQAILRECRIRNQINRIIRESKIRKPRLP